ncbi:hypothetical protein V8Z80_13085 [Orrella sp. JC864]|uniref:hypothetical protein n=1 Tax=Orrella sp. JC864 TaxID=3120298 RepID=UPI00300B2D08
MTIDRRIGLDTALPQGMPDLSQSGAGAQARQAPTDAERQAFERALAGEPGQPGRQAPGEQAGVQRPAPPLALFGAAGLAGAGRPEPAPAPQGLAQALAEGAGALLVGDGGKGRPEVRIELKDELLPGVSVAVFEDEGRLVAAFTCASEASRERLSRGVAALAQELADALGRPALVRVSADDPMDPCTVEAAADALAC